MYYTIEELENNVGDVCRQALSLGFKFDLNNCISDKKYYSVRIVKNELSFLIFTSLIEDTYTVSIDSFRNGHLLNRFNKKYYLLNTCVITTDYEEYLACKHRHN